MKKKSNAVNQSTVSNLLLGKPVIVRASVAGVHAGILDAMDLSTQSVILRKAVRFWRYRTRDATGSISDVAANGLKEPLDQHSIGAVLKSVLISNPPGLEIAEATPEAYESFLKASGRA